MVVDDELDDHDAVGRRLGRSFSEQRNGLIAANRKNPTAFRNRKHVPDDQLNMRKSDGARRILDSCVRRLGSTAPTMSLASPEPTCSPERDREPSTARYLDQTRLDPDRHECVRSPCIATSQNHGDQARTARRAPHKPPIRTECAGQIAGGPIARRTCAPGERRGHRRAGRDQSRAGQVDGTRPRSPTNLQCRCSDCRNSSRLPGRRPEVRGGAALVALPPRR